MSNKSIKTEKSITEKSITEKSIKTGNEKTKNDKSWGDSFRAYLDHRALFLLFLGFAAGLPILLVYANIGIWLREAGLKLSVVTMFSWAALGYSFKFIWAPLIDALPVPILTKWLGRRRAWMLVAQLGVIGAILIIASVDPATSHTLFTYFNYEFTPLVIMAMGAVLLGFSSATQDIVIDAYRIDVAPSSLQPILSSTYIVGYRIGMIVASAGALYMATYFGSVKGAYNYEAWRTTYHILAGIMGISLLTTLTVYEPKTETLQPKKQKVNHIIMSLYSALALIPSIFYGGWYLLNKLFTNIFHSTVFTIPEIVTNIAVKYGTGLAIFMPIALLILIINQPKFKLLAVIKVVEDNKDYSKLVTVFFISIIAFIFAYQGLGGVLPNTKDIDSSLLKFIITSVRMLVCIAVAFITGYILVAIGLVKKEVAMRVWINPILDFFHRYGKKALLLLALIGLYRISDIVAGAITGNLYQDMGFSKVDIANASKLVGVIMAIVGGFVGGLLTQKLDIMKAMMVGASLASATNLLFILLTTHQGDLQYMYFAVIVDNLASGLASAIFVAFLSALTSIRFTAVQYAILSSLMTLFPKVLAGYSGAIVDNIGYPQFFFFTFAIGMPILILIWLVDKYLDIGEPQIGDKKGNE